MKIMYEDIHIGIEPLFHSNYFRKRNIMDITSTLTNIATDNRLSLLCAIEQNFYISEDHPWNSVLLDMEKEGLIERVWEYEITKQGYQLMRDKGLSVLELKDVELAWCEYCAASVDMEDHPCHHPRLDENGMCRICGSDERGINEM